MKLCHMGCGSDHNLCQSLYSYNKYHKFAINVQHHNNCIGCIAKYSREDLSSDELHQMNLSLVTIFANFSHS